MNETPDGMDITIERPELKEILEKDEKSGRQPTGFWYWITAALSAYMVLFYFYSAGFASVATQLHRGVYVFITYVLVFLLYPAGRSWIRYAIATFLGIEIASVVAVLTAYPDVTAYHGRFWEIYAAWTETGAGAALASLVGMWPVWLGAAVIAAGIVWLDRRVEIRSPRTPTVSDVLMALTAATIVLYWILEFENLNYRAGAETATDALVSVIGILLSLEICRRVLGWSMTLIGVTLLGYAYFGPYLPDVIAHRGFGIDRLATFLYLTTNGVYGVMASVLATYVILFIFFGAFLQKSGAGKFFIDLPMALAGKTTGGPAKVAVMASALFGSVSGSAIANTVSTGAFTIPLMKRAGFKPHVAGAIEPAASIGGMFMPPIMGAGGFLMAELTETPYAYIMLIAIAPALLYFFSVFCMIHFEAKKHKIEGIHEENAPTAWAVFKKEWYFSLPLIIITVLMIVGYSPGFSAFWATISCIAISWVRKETRMGIREIWQAIQTGARNTLIIGATLGVIGIIVGTISLTGIGLKFSDIIISLAGGNLLAAVLLVALASLVLGMGVPVTAAYLITAVLAVPPLMELGVVLIAAHMIVYWFSQDSNITPPVCVAAYAGAAIAGSDPWKTGWTAFKYAKLLYVMPLLFAFTPQILFQGKPIVAPSVEQLKIDLEPKGIELSDFDIEMGLKVVKVDITADSEVVEGQTIATMLIQDQIVPLKSNRDGIVSKLTLNAGDDIQPGRVIAEMHARPFNIFSSILSAVLGTIAFSALTMFYWIRKTNWIEWILLAAGTILLYWPTFPTDAAGLALVALVWFSQTTRNRRDAAAAAA